MKKKLINAIASVMTAALLASSLTVPVIADDWNEDIAVIDEEDYYDDSNDDSDYDDSDYDDSDYDDSNYDDSDYDDSGNDDSYDDSSYDDSSDDSGGSSSSATPTPTPSVTPAPQYPTYTESKVDIRGIVETDDKGLNFRAGPYVLYEPVIIGTIPKGTELHITKLAKTSVDETWGYTEYKNTKGWVIMSSILEINPDTTTTTEAVTTTETVTTTTTEEVITITAPPETTVATTEAVVSPTRNFTALTYGLLAAFVLLAILAIALLVMLKRRDD